MLERRKLVKDLLVDRRDLLLVCGLGSATDRVKWLALISPTRLEKLRARKILVRWFKYPAVREFLGITIGTDAEADALLRASKAVLKAG